MIKRCLLLVLFVLVSLSTAHSANRFALSVGMGLVGPSGTFNDFNAQTEEKAGRVSAKYNQGAETLASPFSSYGIKVLYNIRGLEPYLHLFRSNFDMSEQFLFTIEAVEPDSPDTYRRGKHHVNVLEIGARKYFTIFTEEFFAEGGVGYFYRKSAVYKNNPVNVLSTTELTESESKTGFCLGGGYRIYFSDTVKFDLAASFYRTFQKPIQFWRFTVTFTNYFF